jgi:hypothetical protein
VIIYDKETIKICNQLGSHKMALEKDEPSSGQQRKTSETSTAKLKFESDAKDKYEIRSF